jgi:glycosyltransferase involved in cell wall biosynthesis
VYLIETGVAGGSDRSPYSSRLAMMTDRGGGASRTQTVSVVVPFFGDEAAADAVAEWLGRLELAGGDEAIVADNTPDGVFARRDRGVARVAAAGAERSSYHARNRGAEESSGDWLLFLDADCVPPPDLIARYLVPVPDEDVAILAGAIVPAAGQAGLLPEWAATREILSQKHAARSDPPAAATANLMVRRSAWSAAGGFLEGVRSGADHEFCWRVGARGGRLELRPEAAVEHVHRTTLRGVVRQMARYSAGNAWQRRRRAGVAPPARSGGALARAVAGAGYFLVTLRPRRAALKGVDGVAAVAQAGGRWLPNTVAEPLERAPGRLVVVTDRFPVASETFITGEISALRRLGARVRVEAVARAESPALGGARDLDVRYLEDETIPGRAAALAWALARHPLRALGDRRLRRRFAAEERMPLSAIAPLARRLARGGDAHVHVHFAALAAVNALRAGHLVGRTVSIAPHGHELFVTPRALPEKLGRAAFVAAPCEYTAREVRAVAPAGTPIGIVVMGVDGERFRRRGPGPGRTVVAVGRLVEKKGFADLVDAVALLDPGAAGDVVIAGDGPLRESLARRIADAGVGDRVRLAGAVDPATVRDLLEGAGVMAVPCVVAGDGDRDAMPVVAKEALAMEVPVVGTHEVGLPELIRDGWGRLVPPRDPQALATAIAELLALPAAERARMGAAGRAFVLANFDQESQARKLLGMIRAVAPAA